MLMLVLKRNTSDFATSGSSSWSHRCMTKCVGDVAAFGEDAMSQFRLRSPTGSFEPKQWPCMLKSIRSCPLIINNVYMLGLDVVWPKWQRIWPYGFVLIPRNLCSQLNDLVTILAGIPYVLSNARRPSETSVQIPNINQTHRNNHSNNIINAYTYLNTKYHIILHQYHIKLFTKWYSIVALIYSILRFINIIVFCIFGIIMY